MAMRKTFIVLSLLIAPELFADSDLSINIQEFSRGSDLVTWRSYVVATEAARGVVVRVSAPSSVDVHYTIQRNPVQDCNAGFCALWDLAAGERVRLEFDARLHAEGPVKIALNVFAVTPDPNLANNAASVTINNGNFPDLRLDVFTSGYTRRDPGASVTYYVHAGNASFTAVAHNVVLTARLAPGTEVVAVKPYRNGETLDCDVAANVVTCRSPVDSSGMVIDGNLPRSGTTATATFEISSSDPQFTDLDKSATLTLGLYRTVEVVNVADDGAGSLRQAIRDSVDCATGCKIKFNIPPPVPSSGVFTIQPLTPLPDVVGESVIIDGTTQADARIELNGALAGNASGFVLRQRFEAGVTGITISGFGDAGIMIAGKNEQFFTYGPGVAAISSNTITGNGRGVVVGSGTYSLTKNVIANNRFSGVFVWSGSGGMNLNEISGNGASGIFINNAASNTTISRNTIANNAQFGVSIAPHAVETWVTQNSIKGNRLIGIDIGLDLVTPNAPSDRATYPNSPRLVSAKYDAVTNETTITGRIDGDQADGIIGGLHVEFFASDALSTFGYAEGETYLGTIDTGYIFTSFHRELTLVVKGDLTGKWITATSSRFHVLDFGSAQQVPQPFPPISEFPYTATSEFSNPIRATR